jgi:hypothetical protein
MCCNFCSRAEGASSNADRHDFASRDGDVVPHKRVPGVDPPGPSKHQPPLDIEAPPHQFDIGEEMCHFGN